MRLNQLLKYCLLIFAFSIYSNPFHAEDELMFFNKEDCYWDDQICGYNAYYDYLYDVDFNCDRLTNYFILCERIYFRSYNTNLLGCNAKYINCVKRGVQGK